MTTEVEALNEAWNRAWLEKDAVALERMMAGDYTYITPEGKILDREAILDIIRAPGYKLFSGTRTEVSVRRISRDAAAVIHRFQGEGSFEGQGFTDDHRVTTICVRVGDDWRVLMEQCSNIAP